VGDASWFYSSLAQVTAALVGLLGGFLTLRLLGYMNDWRQLEGRLKLLQNSWVLADLATENNSQLKTPTEQADARREENRLWNELLFSIEERETAVVPREFLWGGLTLFLLLIAGVLLPLLLLDQPDVLEKSGLLALFAALVLLFSSFIYVGASSSLESLQREDVLWERTQGRYEDHQMTVEGWRLRRGEEAQRRLESTDTGETPA
jgi:hypothetical protein